MRLNNVAFKVIRERSGFSLAAIAEATGIDRSNLTHIEAGRRRGTAKQIKDLARALDVPVLAIAQLEEGEAS